VVYKYNLNGLQIETGDLICTTDGDSGDVTGQFWRIIGKLIPGEVDHIVIYVGPEGRCLEAGAKGRVIAFDIVGNAWDVNKMRAQRGPFIDVFHGVAYPLEGKGLNPAELAQIRENVAIYCLAPSGKPYNLNFLNSETEGAFYCSQLAYKAYLKQGIDLNTGIGVPDIPGTESIIFPQELWAGCSHTAT
jgi:hypothetical protein